MEDKIYKLEDMTLENRREWVRGLNASGYAGVRRENGMLCDRRQFPDAIPVQKNSLFGVVEPKPLTNENLR